MTTTRPIVGIPLGDPAGVGPEIVVKALAEPRIYATCKPLVIGNRVVLERAREACGLGGKLQTIDSPHQGNYVAGTLDLIDVAQIDATGIEWGTAQPAAGTAAFAYIEHAVKLAFARELDAVATPPINKVALRLAGIPYLGHTEILAGLTGAHDPLTMFEVRDLRIFFLTRHVPLREACDLVKRDRVLDTIIRASKALDKLRVAPGRLAVAGLNPHSGDGGLLGREEIDEIAPAIEGARDRGYEVDGPIGADTVFHLALQGRYRAVISLYHDQGHIAAKTVDFERTVAITNGLPFLRTSVDHGTAFDIAGSGKANSVSMIEAILAAAKYAPCFAG